ncbi:MAG: histidine kinase [Propionibacterium sp.]|nr:histidine kinase [Propionibacterium sp.]
MTGASVGEGLWAPARFRGRTLPLVLRVLILALTVGSVVTDLAGGRPGSHDEFLRFLEITCLTLGFAAVLWFPLPGIALSLIGVGAGVVVDPVATVIFAGFQLIVLVGLDTPLATRRYSWSLLLFMLVGVVAAPRDERMAPIILGLIVGVVLLQQHYSDRLRRRLGLAVEARATAEQSAREAVSVERRRLADDLHDIIAHDLTIIGMQADMALIKQDQQASDQTLRSISDSSREALANLRLMMDTLELAEDEHAPVASPAEVAAITASRLNTLGHSVELSVDTEIAHLDAGPAAVLSQILRECGTNVAKHADPKAPVRITCAVEGGELVLTVANPLPRTDESDRDWPTSNGQGTVSMASRAAAAGGSLRLGPHGDDWVVSARLPIHAHADPRGWA